MTPPAMPVTHTNDLGQPLGAPLPGWHQPERPPRTPMTGRCCRLEPIDVGRHANDLYAANALDTDGRGWTYLPYGPFADRDAYRAWMRATCLGDDPLFHAVVDLAGGMAVGVASYLRIDPPSGAIEVGHLRFSPRLQRSPASTEAMYLMMRRVFELGYRRYEWKCDALNAPSRAAALRLGFTFEGVFRQATVYKGRNRDSAWFSILDSEWPRLDAGFRAWLDPANFDDAGSQRRRLGELLGPLPHARHRSPRSPVDPRQRRASAMVSFMSNAVPECGAAPSGAGSRTRGFRRWVSLAPLVLLCLGLALLHTPARAQLPPGHRRCIRALDAGFAKVAKARATHNLACLERAAKAKLTSTLADCLAADPRGAVRRAGDTLAVRAAARCAAAPPFGATDAATVTEAAAMRELLLTYDLFGGPIDGVMVAQRDDRRTAMCQRRLVQRAQRCQTTRYRAFDACTGRGLGTGAIGNAAELAACLDADPRGKIAAACDGARLARVAARCAGVDLAGAFPGCGASDPAALGRCLDRSIACGACTALDQAHRLGHDCDRFDDGLADGSCAACPPAGPLPNGQALYDDLATYVGFGIRRTGTPGATRSADWLAEALARLGFTVERQPFAFTQFDWDAAASSLVVDGVSYDVVPAWFPAAGSVQAELASYDAGNPVAVAGKIALVPINARVLTDRSPTHLAIQGAITAGARGVVAVNGFRDEAVALNADAPFNETAWPVPVVIVGGRHRAALEAGAGRPAIVTLAGAAGPGAASNVVARWTGSPGAPTIVVSTPYTGWFTTAGERGPGIALFLGLARWVSRRNAGANYVFVAFAGMELGSLGERVFLDPSNRPPRPDAVAAWLHLGAGIVTTGVERAGADYVRTGPEYGVSIATPGWLVSVADCALARAGTFVAVPPALAGGSLEVVVDAGYAALGLQGTNDLYHTAEDTLGRNTPDAALLQPVAVGLVRALVALGG